VTDLTHSGEVAVGEPVEVDEAIQVHDDNLLEVGEPGQDAGFQKRSRLSPTRNETNRRGQDQLTARNSRTT
jgi:hypothetical protein